MIGDVSNGINMCATLHTAWLEDWVKAFGMWMSFVGTISFPFLFGECMAMFVVS